MGRRSGWSLVAALLLWLSLLPLPTAVGAATFSVNTVADLPNSNPASGLCQTAVGAGVCSLRAAIQAANNTPGPDTIVLPAGVYLLDRPGLDDVGAIGDLDFVTGTAVTILGAGAATTIIDGNGAVTNDRVIDINAGASVTIKNVTIRRGRANIGFVGHSHGGGIHNHGTLLLSDSVVRDSQTQTNDPNWGGGGITNAGAATLRHVTIQGNTTWFRGGGLENAASATAATLDHVTVTGNITEDTTGTGAGIDNAASLTLTNGTISDNKRDAAAMDGIYNRGAGAVLTVANSTISGNGDNGLTNDDATATLTNVTISGHPGTGLVNIAGPFGTATTNLSQVTLQGNGYGLRNLASGGIAPSTVILRLRNTIIGKSGTASCAAGSGPTPGLTSLGSNLDADGSCALTGTGDRSGLDPRLDPLGDNGGPTLTHALQPGSPALDTGNSGPACLNVAGQAIAADQRGFPRPRDGDNNGTARCDIGAYEAPAAVTASTEWYFAEGYTGPGFDEYLTIQNANGAPAVVTITYFLTGLAPVTKVVTVAANSRYTVVVHEAGEGVGRGQAVSARLVSTLPIVVERPMYFTYNGSMGQASGGHNVMGAIAPRTSWYFAEGYTGPGFDQYLTIMNPHARDVPVTITYFLTGAPPVTRPITLPPSSRYTVQVHGDSEGVGRDQAVSARVVTTDAGGVVAERPMYFAYSGSSTNVRGGHNVIGANEPRAIWYFPDGNTAAGVDQYLTIMNPAASDAAVRLTYYRGGGATTDKEITVPANSRYTVAVHDSAEGVGRGLTPGTRVESTNGVGLVVERPIYLATGGDNVMGAGLPSQTWLFAEGYTGTGFDEYLVLLNPNATEAIATITYYLASGATVTKQVAVAARTRRAVAVHELAEGVGRDQPVSARVTTTHKGGLVVERPIYFTYNGAIPGYHTAMGFTR